MIIDLPGGITEIDLNDPSNQPLKEKCQDFMFQFSGMILDSVSLKHPEFNKDAKTELSLSYVRRQIVAGVNYYFGIYVSNPKQSVLVHMRVYEKSWEQTTQGTVIDVEQLVEIESK